VPRLGNSIAPLDSGEPAAESYTDLHTRGLPEDHRTRFDGRNYPLANMIPDSHDPATDHGERPFPGGQDG
jgi:hypothetical protein